MGCLYKIGYWSWVSIYYAFGVSMLVAYFDQFGASWGVNEEVNAEAWFPYFCTVYWSLANFFGPFNQRRRMKKGLILFFFGFVFAAPLLKAPALSPVFAYVVLTLFPFVLFLYYSYLDARMEAKIKSLEKLKKRAQEQKMREKHRMAKKNEEEKERARMAFNNEVVEKLKDLYGDKYDYSRVDFKGMNRPIELVCRKHGQFIVYARKTIVGGIGCPKCAMLDRLSNKKSGRIGVNVSGPTKKEAPVKKREGSTLLDAIETLGKNFSKDLESLKAGQKKLIKMLSSLLEDVNEIKNQGLETESAVIKIYERIEASLPTNHDQRFIDMVVGWYDHWETAEKNTKIFMPGAEMIFENIQKEGFVDYSAFVIYYCRSLENELLKKIFYMFIKHVEELKDPAVLFDWDKEGLRDSQIKRYNNFFEDFKRKLETKKFTLGDMWYVINLLPVAGKKTDPLYHRSFLIKKLSSFIKNKSMNINKETIDGLDLINKKYRRRAAHIDIINKDEALVFYKKFKKLMNALFSSLDQF